jgi:nicotinamidase-related amidase
VGVPIEIAQRIQLSRSALLLVDMQRRHLDLDIGYHTLAPPDAQRVLRSGSKAVSAARQHDLKVVHVATWSRKPSPWGPADGRNPLWAYQNGKPIPGAGFVRQAGKCTEDSPYAEIMPTVAPQQLEPVVIKKRYSGFFNTDLDTVLRGFDVETLFVAGVNTNNCVLGTVFDAHARDYLVVVLEDACGSMNGADYHTAALAQIRAALGFTMSSEAFIAMLSARDDTVPASTGSGGCTS